MSIEIKVPQLPESITEATLVSWHKKRGEHVERDENLVDIETDKVVLEVPAPAAGVLKEIRAEDGATVIADQTIGVFEEGAEKGAETTALPAEGDERPSGRNAGNGEPTEVPGESAGMRESEPGSKMMPLSPSVRRLVEEHGLDPTDIRASGRDGRLTKADVLAHLEHAPQKSEKTTEPTVWKKVKESRGEVALTQPASAALPVRGRREERRVPMSRIRARIAERMIEAQSTTAMLTSFNEIDMGTVVDLRKRYREDFEKRYGVRLGYLSFFVKAAVQALQRFPVVNASVEDRVIVYHDYWDIGVAVSTARGLVVPVIRDVDRLSFAEIEAKIIDYAGKAREGGLALEDITGGTFTITNGGVFGSLFSTPIINPPQSAILGMHKIQQRPMVVGGEIRIRPMMYVAITYDHRIVDGREAVQFLVAVKEALEDPARLLIDL